MLAALTRILRERDLVPNDEPLAFDVSLVSHEQLTLQAFVPGGARFHARVKRRGIVADEYERCCAAWQSFPEQAPRPLARCFVGGWEIIVFAGIGHKSIAPGDIGRDRYRLVDQLVAYFSTARRIPAAAYSHRAYLRMVRERVTHPAAAAVLDEWLASDELERFPCVPQHGDFTVNNLGVADGRLVIFDWEDFGRASLPGLDLCTAIASDIGLESTRSGDLVRGGRARLVARACLMLGVAPELFIRLVPLYLAVFLDLKRDYGEGVRQAVAALLARLCEGTAHRPH